MPYYIYIVSTSAGTTRKTVAHVSEYANFKLARTEVRRLRAETTLEDGQSYRIMFAEERAEAEKRLLEHREEPIAREWEK